MSDLKLPPFTIQSEINPNEIPWGVKHINAPKAWESSKGENVIVAILDTGCDNNHPDLAGRILDGRNFTPDYSGDTNNYSDNQGHGTHCAGVVAGVINNDGVWCCTRVKLIIGKVGNVVVVHIVNHQRY
jgi:major intracellular serine protease